MNGGFSQDTRVLEGAVADLARPIVRFKAWRIVSGESDPIAITATTLAEAVDQAKVRCTHKQVLEILETGPRFALLHTYRIKKSSTKGFYREAYDGGPRVFVNALEAELVVSRKVADYAPVEPFRWSPGCDVVGIDRSLVEQRA